MAILRKCHIVEQLIQVGMPTSNLNQQLTKEKGRGIDYKDICILYCQPELQKYIVLNIVQTLRHKAIVEIHNL